MLVSTELVNVLQASCPCLLTRTISDRQQNKGGLILAMLDAMLDLIRMERGAYRQTRTAKGPGDIRVPQPHRRYQGTPHHHRCTTKNNNAKHITT